MSTLAKTASRSASKTAGDFLEERIVVVPGPQLVDADAAVAASSASISALAAANGSRVSASSSSNSLRPASWSCSFRVELHDVVVLEAELLRRLVAQRDQLPSGLPSTSAPTPLLASQTACRSLESSICEHLADLAVGQSRLPPPWRDRR